MRRNSIFHYRFTLSVCLSTIREKIPPSFLNSSGFPISTTLPLEALECITTNLHITSLDEEKNILSIFEKHGKISVCNSLLFWILKCCNKKSDRLLWRFKKFAYLCDTLFESMKSAQNSTVGWFLNHYLLFFYLPQLSNLQLNSN